ncbi:MAG TPA: glycosyltransferase family 87 protein [Spirochaetota bacterium]|nr:glycosyltransferase family 87 protein [Spirochaetota bacterium]HOS33906.1 glycosyltransferase family 87 protein [Spirochaetota bacterium]HOS56874.1 glycosyltransferase family 87 protein [Spirochaetota bacterium]HPK62394.1 glycosyltransferase family 87 protein [Spirochaetota bacterium]HQF79107.1 glycosyltransferase family 87 protein [Spirochaetota bacterium]
MTFFSRKDVCKAPVFVWIILSLTAVLTLFSIYFFLLTGKNDVCAFKNLKRANYIHFYNGGKIIASKNRTLLYDKSFFEKEIADKYKEVELPKNEYIFYNPLTYYIFVPFSIFSFNLSLFIYASFLIILYLVSIVLLIKTFRRLFKYRFLILLLSLIFPPFIISFFSGQPSVIWLFIFALSFYFSKKDKIFLSGILLSALLLKINFYIIIFIIILFSFRPKLLLGFVLGSFSLIIVSGVFDSFVLWKEWIDYSLLSRFHNIYSLEENMLYRQHSVKSFFHLFYSTGSVGKVLSAVGLIVGITSIIFPILYSIVHKSNFSRNSFWTTMILSLVLANPNTFDFDLIVLALPIIVFFNYAIIDRISGKNIIIMFSLFFAIVIVSSAVSFITRLQLSVPIFYFFMVNSFLGVRIKEYFPKAYNAVWEDYK